MSATKAAGAAKAAAERRRVWYVMTSRMGREPRAKGKRIATGQEGPRNDNGGEPSRCAAPTEKEEINAEV